MEIAEGSYGSEDQLEDESGDDLQDYDSDEIREVNKANLINYESDDSDDAGDSDDSDNFGNQLRKQKEDLQMNDTWGSKKKNFYGRDKK